MRKAVSFSLLNILWFLGEDLVSISNSLLGILEKLHCSSGNSSQRSVRSGVAFMLIVNKDCFGKTWKSLCTFRHLMMYYVPNLFPPYIFNEFSRLKLSLFLRGLSICFATYFCWNGAKLSIFSKQPGIVQHHGIDLPPRGYCASCFLLNDLLTLLTIHKRFPWFL